MKTHTLSVLVAASEHLDIYSLTQALAEKGISNLIQTTLDEEHLRTPQFVSKRTWTDSKSNQYTKYFSEIVTLRQFSRTS